MQHADDVMMQARRLPSKLAARDLASGREWRYAELDRAIGQFVAALRARGIVPGDRVAALAKNRLELIMLHFACARLGTMYVPLNWRLAEAELRALLRDAEPALLLGDGHLTHAGLEGADIDAFATDAEMLEPIELPVPDHNAPSLVLYTSGTSGPPKGVLLSEHNIRQSALNFAQLGEVRSDSVVLCDAPMFHIIGLITNIRPGLMLGATLMISDGFLPSRTLTRLSDPALRVTHYFCVPQMAALLHSEPGFDPAPLRGLTAIFSGGAPHSAEAIRRWLDDGITMANGFGMSETGTVSCMPLDRDLIRAKAGACGLIPPGIEYRVVDAKGEDCGEGPGELLLRGATVTSGYWHRPDQTATAFTADGWFRTGDIARIDADRFLWLLDRKKDMFISGGENVYPTEIEAALSGHPSVIEAAVVGVPNARWGEVGHLFIVPRPGSEIDDTALLAFLSERLARYKLPKHITRLDVLPRSGAGKVLKPELRRATGPAAPHPPPDATR